MPIKVNDNTFLNRQEAADYINYSKGTLEVWASIKKNYLTYVMYGGRAYYCLAVLNEFLERSLIS